MNSTEKQLRCGEIATSALGKIAREIAKAVGPKKRRPQSEEAAEKSAKNILEEIVLPVLKKCQQDIRAVMDGVADSDVDPETGEAVEITDMVDHDGRV